MTRTLPAMGPHGHALRHALDLATRRKEGTRRDRRDARTDTRPIDIRPCPASAQRSRSRSVAQTRCSVTSRRSAHLRDSSDGCVRSVPWDGSPLGYGKRLAAVTAPQVQVMIRHQDDSKSVLVAIEAAEPLENGLGVPRLLGSKVHAASRFARDCICVVYGPNIRPTPTARILRAH